VAPSETGVPPLVEGLCRFLRSKMTAWPSRQRDISLSWKAKWARIPAPIRKAEKREGKRPPFFVVPSKTGVPPMAAGLCRFLRSKMTAWPSRQRDISLSVKAKWARIPAPIRKAEKREGKRPPFFVVPSKTGVPPMAAGLCRFCEKYRNVDKIPAI